MKRKFAGGGALDPEVAAEADKQMSFGDAFKAARGHGLKTFEYKGKKYTTDMAADKPKAPVSDKPKAPGSEYKPRATTGPTRQITPMSEAETIRRMGPTGPGRTSKGLTIPDEMRNPRLLSNEALDDAVKKPYKAGGGVKRYARGGGIEAKGKTRGKMC